MEKKIIIVDIEISGLLFDGGKIIEIGIVELDLDSGKILPVFDRTVKDRGFEDSSIELNLEGAYKYHELIFEEVNNVSDIEDVRVEIQDVFYRYQAAAYN